MPTGNIISFEPAENYSAPTVLNRTVYPGKVKHGDVLLTNLAIEDEYGIESVTGEIEGIDNLSFYPVDGTENRIWQNAWIVHTTENMKWYNTNITIKNLKGEITMTSVRWQDPTVYHHASEVLAGTFDSGDFTFQDNLTITGNLAVTSSIVTIGGKNVLTEDDAIPSGAIIMWSGSYDTIPTGWWLCDGSNGTPNMIDRFIYGVNSSYASGNDGDINATGGATSHNHTVDSHTHTVDPPSTYVAAPWINGAGSVWYESNSYDHHSPYVDIAEFTSGAASPGTSSENHLPPYYKLAFIMKL